MFWLGQSGKISVNRLLEIYETVEEFDLKEKCLFGISQKSGKKSQEVLLKIGLDKSSNIELREKAIFWIRVTLYLLISVVFST